MLGTGSFGTVYLAEHLKLKIYRAIKRIPRNVADKSFFSLDSGFPKEAELLKNLSHPGIPLIYDIDEDDDYIYMIEEFVQGESLESYVLHQEYISQELIIKMGIQLCDVLDYLHHLSPYPILYQDLKPEHIIVCGNQLKLIDFGIASFFTGSGKAYQIYGTDGFVAPEALSGQPATPSADIYGAGRILEFLANAADFNCPIQLKHIIRCATAAEPSERYPTAGDMKSALIRAQHQPCRHSSHLIKNLAVIGSRPGAGATHIAIALTSTLGKKGFPALYLPMDKTDTLGAIARAKAHVTERDGIFSCGYFRGMPDYGEGVFLPLPPKDCYVKDYGTRPVALSELEMMDIILFVLSGAAWDIQEAAAYGKQLSLLPQTVFICNHANQSAARELARLLGRRVYCFPHDLDPYRVSAEKERLFSKILHLCEKGGKKHFWF